MGIQNNLLRQLLGPLGKVEHKTYTHTLTLHDEPIGICVASDFSTDPFTITLALNEGVDEDDVRKMAEFSGINIEFVCPECHGEGEVSTDVDDGEGHTMRGVGTEKCRCQIKDEEPDDQDRE